MTSSSSPTGSEHDALVKLVERILAAKRADPAADTSAWEREMDSPREIGRDSPADLGLGRLISRGKRVYRCYGLTAEEINLVEEGAGQ